ncbi:MAG: ABC transporter permease [Coriobacteriales bacterium]|nr:ABC transporter permease [Coriobacteriales bacterium]
MVQIARKSLLRDKARFAVSSGGVALSVLLILLLGGMQRGVNEQITAYIDHAPADVIVAQEGNHDFLGARSRIALEDEARVARMSGVSRVVPVISQYAVVEVHGRKEFTLLVGFDRTKGGGPWRIAEGKGTPAENEVVADAAVGKARRLSIGDTVEILGKRFKVVGFSSGTSSWMTGTFFMDFEEASELVASRGAPSFLLVQGDRGQSSEALARRIELRLRDTAATPREVVNANDRKLYARILNGPIGFMTLIAFLIGTSVVGLTIYTATVERSKEYGSLKAIGIRNTALYAIVFEQSVFATTAGLSIGIALAYAAARLIPVLAPRFMVVIEPSAVLRLGIAAFAMAVLAAIVPVRAVASIDPAIAFRRGA